MINGKGKNAVFHVKVIHLLNPVWKGDNQNILVQLTFLLVFIEQLKHLNKMIIILSDIAWKLTEEAWMN